MEDSSAIRRSVWISSIITLIVLAIFVAISTVIPQQSGRGGLVLMGLFLALVPAVVWMAFFNQQDRSEPEPKRLIVRTFVFGALAAAAVGVPFASEIATQTTAQYPSVVVQLLLTILTLSLVQEILKVAMVRYVVLGTDQFDRHPDGIIYGLASGLGFATVLTVSYVLREGGVLPLAGAIRAVDNALVHGALGAVSGYYLGRVKIDGKKVSWLIIGIGIVTAINGVYQVAQNEIARGQLAYNPWFDLAGAVVLALGVGAVLFAFFRRAMARAVGDLQTISEQSHARDRYMPWDIKVRYDMVLVGGLVIALVVGLGAAQFAQSRSLRYSAADLPMTFTYPARWGVEGGEAGTFAARDLNVGGLYKPSITIIAEKVTDGSAFDFNVTQQVIVHEQTRAFYTETLDDRDQSEEATRTVGGEPAIRIEYRYAYNTEAGPVVIKGIETFVQVGTQLYIFRYEAEPEAYMMELAYYERLLKSLRFDDSE